MSRPLRSGRAPRPGPDSDGQDATLTSPPRSGRAQCPARARVGPDHLGLACHPTRLSATGYSRPNAPCVPGPALAKAIVDVLWQHPAGAGTFHRGATSTGGLGSEPGQRRARRAPRPIDYPTARQAPRATRGQTPDSADHSAGGEGLPQTTPLLSSRGCKWGPNPLSSMNTYQPEVLCSAPKPSRDTPEGGS